MARYFCIVFPLLFCATLSVCAQHIVFVKGNCMGACAIETVDSIKMVQTHIFDVYPKGWETARHIDADTVLFNTVLTDTLHVHFKDSVTSIVNPDIMGIVTDVSQTTTEITTTRSEPLICKLSGVSSNQRVVIKSDTTITLVLDNLTLSSETGSCISLPNRHTAFVELTESTNNIITDATIYADSGDEANAALYAGGSIYFSGEGFLTVRGRHKHAINSRKGGITINANVKIPNAVDDGIRADSSISVENGSVYIDSVAGSGLHADHGNVEFHNGLLDVRLAFPDTKGIKADNLFSQSGGKLLLHLLADQSKGVKANRGIVIDGGTILGDASGGAVVKKGDPSYCTFLKSDDTIRISNSAIQLSHTGMGGKGISSDRDFLFENSMLTATFACDGSGYLNAEGEEDYYTSKILDSDGNMLIRSGHVDILQKGLGGKGITCDGNLELGEMLAEDSLLQMTIETQGSAIINDTILDKRFGCPKAYKGKSHVYVYSGRINAVTHGMGGEGIECNGYMKIEGGEITCETFDDGINVQKNLTINGGKTYVFSSDNDGIDLNGNLTINGGMVVALNAHFRDEAFDCDEYRNFTINGGTILGIARDFSRPTEVNQPYAQHTPALWRPDYSGKDSVNVHDFHKGECITIADHDSNPYVTVRMPADVPCAFITASAPWMKDGEDVYVFQSESVPENSTLTLSGKTFLGGSTMQGAPLITIPITTKILGATTN